MKINKKAGLLLVLLVIVLSVSGGGSWAYLKTGPEMVTNAFQPAYVDTEIDEVFSGSSKTSIVVKNKSNIAVFIRVALIGNWVKDGNIIEPWDGTVMPRDGWVQHGNYYYFTAAVEAGEETNNLLRTAIEQNGSRSDGAVLHIDVLQQGIQAEPASLVQEVWKVNPINLGGAS